MSRFLSLFFLSIIFLYSESSYSQDPPIKWGEVPMSDLEMTSFPADSNATVVILCDYGETKFNDDLEIEFSTHQRIKILSEKGYDWGTKSIYLYTGNNGERLDDLEAITYSLDDDGKIIATELDDDQIFEEEVSDTREKVTFTMPAMKPGCVIDIRYKIISESIWGVKSWYFQDNEPVLWSEYRFIFPKQIAYAIVNQGFEFWEINEYKEIKQVFNGSAASYVGKIADCNYYRWAVKNAQALRNEAYVTTIKDYLNKVDIQISGYRFGSTVKKLLNDWKTLSDELLDNEYFTEKIDPDEVEDLTQSITKNLSTLEDKMFAIYNWIIKSIVWSGENAVFADQDVDEVIEYKKGNSAEITFLLISMLRSAGIDAEPVILSTRSHGKIQDIYPIVSQFNYVITRAKIGTSTFYVDATNPLRPINVLPEKILNVRGLVIKSGKPEWVNISTNNENKDQSLINMELNTDGSVKVNFTDKFGEYKSLDARDDFEDKTDLDFVKEYYDPESLGFAIDLARVMEKDSIDKPLRIQTSMSSADYAQTGGDMIYLNPCIIHRLKDNPFKVEQRKFPIDYAYPRSQTIVINVSIPEGYELKECYNNKSISVGGRVSFKRQKQIMDNKIVQILTKIEIKESIINSKYYDQLKRLYEQIISAESEMLVFGPKSSSNTMDTK